MLEQWWNSEKYPICICSQEYVCSQYPIYVHNILYMFTIFYICSQYPIYTGIYMFTISYICSQYPIYVHSIQ